MKIPHFPWYPDDWISSRKRLSLTYRQQGIYILLLSHSWNKELPNDKKTLQLLCPGARWTDIEKVLSTCFTCDGQRHANDKLATIQLKVNDIGLKRSYAAKCLHNKKSKDAHAEHMQCTCSANQNQNHNKDIRKRPPANPSVRILQEYLSASFEKKFGSKPVMSYPSIGKQLKHLLDQERFTESALKEMIDWFLTSPKAAEHPTPAAAISTDTVQRWQVACPEVK